MIRIGTNHFTSIRGAQAYYAPYGCDLFDIMTKIRSGEIHIGKPELKPGQRLRIIDNGTRYAIVEDEVDQTDYDMGPNGEKWGFPR